MISRLKFLLIPCLLVPYSFSVCFPARYGINNILILPSPKLSSPKPNTEAYSQLKDSILKVRDAFAHKYLMSHKPVQQKRILDSARHTFLSILQNRIFPAWYGTSWDFYGKTEAPRTGAIACGYFVATCLRDMGLQLDRLAMGDLQSEDMIRKLVVNKCVKVFEKGQKIADFVAEIKQSGDALYILGLDYHTGFLQCKHGNVYFVNATMPYVAQQVPEQAGFLAYSKYRVSGCISADNTLIKKWLLKQYFA